MSEAAGTETRSAIWRSPAAAGTRAAWTAPPEDEAATERAAVGNAAVGNAAAEAHAAAGNAAVGNAAVGNAAAEAHAASNAAAEAHAGPQPLDGDDGALEALGEEHKQPDCDAPRAPVDATPPAAVPRTADVASLPAPQPQIFVPTAPLQRWDVEPAARPAAPRVRPSVAGRLLQSDGTPREMLARVGVGAALASTYGLALGAREGGSSLLVHALGVPSALLAVPLLGLPALFILLAFFDAPLSPKSAAGAAVRGVVSGGMVLAGLAPLAALYVVTSGSDSSAELAGALGLAVGGALGLRQLVGTLRRALESADSATRAMATLSQLGFASFAVLLAWRIWSGVLPLMGGAL